MKVYLNYNRTMHNCTWNMFWYIFAFAIYNWRIYNINEKLSDQFEVVMDCPSSTTLADISLETLSASSFLKIISDQQVCLLSQQTALASQQETIKSMEKLLSEKEESKRQDVKKIYETIRNFLINQNLIW